MAADVIVCRPASALNRRSRRRLGLPLRPARCSTCGCEVLATAGTLARRDRAEATLLCVRCAAKTVAASGREPVLVLAAEAAAELDRRRRELASELGVDVARVTASAPALLAAAIGSTRRQN